jgi:hypothetical protein
MTPDNLFCEKVNQRTVYRNVNHIQIHHLKDVCYLNSCINFDDLLIGVSLFHFNVKKLIIINIR